MSDPVLNRYTSDSWSLELSAESSPLSRWTRKPVVKGEHFRLSLLGFETGSAPISWLEGDRPLLETLHQAVESYVQSNLQKPSRMAGPDGAALLDPASNVVPIAGTGTPEAQGTPRVTGANAFALESDGTAGHRLHYNPAGTQARTLKLSTLQLADLLEVLDRWQGESMALPEDGKTQLAAVASQSDFVMPAWGRIAASAAIALGAATGGIYLFSQPGSQTASVSGDAAIESSEAVDEFGAFPQVSSNPSGELPNAPVGSSPQQFSAPFLKQSSGQRFGNIDEESLPGLESGEVADATLSDPDGIDDASVLDLDGIDTSTISSADFLPPPIPEPDLGLPSSGFDVTAIPDTAIASAPVLTPPAPVEPAPVEPAAASLPTTSASSSFDDAQAELAAAEAELLAQSEAALSPEAPAGSSDFSLAGSASAGASTAAANSEAAKVANDAAPASASIAESSELASATVAADSAPVGDAPESAVTETVPAPTIAAQANDVAVAKPAATSPAPVARAKPTGAVQSAAVKSYFESRWQPPEELQQSLQYQLILSNEGSIEKMNPLSPAATKYSDAAGIPSVGDPFIPAATDIQDATLVLTLGDDGSVNVSVENVTPKP